MVESHLKFVIDIEPDVIPYHNRNILQEDVSGDDGVRDDYE